MMKSLVSRALLFGLGLFLELSTVAAPATVLEPFTATFEAYRSASYASATARMDYAGRTLRLVLQPRMPSCPAGRVCIQAFPPPQTLFFKNVRINLDACGVVQTRALSEKTVVTLIDRSHSTCESNAEFIAELSVKSRWSAGGETGATMDSFAVARDLRAKLSGVASQLFESGTVIFNCLRGEVKLTLVPYPFGCTKGRTCPQPPPDPVVLSMTNAQTAMDACGVISTVAFIDNRQSDGQVQKVTIHDNRQNICPTYLPLATLDVIYETSEYSDKDQDLVILSSDLFSSAEIE